MDSTYMSDQEEKGLRAAGLDELANYQLAVHNPQSTLHAAASSDQVRRNIRDFLDVDHLTSLKLADHIIGEVRPLVINEAISRVTKYHPVNKLFLKRNVKKMREESNLGDIETRLWPNDSDYRHMLTLRGERPPPRRVVGGYSVSRNIPLYGVYRKKHPVPYEDKIVPQPRGLTAHDIRKYGSHQDYWRAERKNAKKARRKLQDVL